MFLKAVVVAQSIMRPHSTPEVRGSNPVIGKLLYVEHLCTVYCIEKNENQEKEAGKLL